MGGKTNMKLQYLPANTDAQEIQNQLEKHGAVIIEDVIDQTTVDQLNSEIDPFITSFLHEYSS